jgi:malonyl-CoA decarboxylase
MNNTTFKTLLQKLSSLGLETLELFKPKQRQDFSATMQSLCQSLLGLQGEAASIAIAEEIFSSYQNASVEEKAAFFLYLHDGLAADTTKVNAAIAKYQAAPSQAALQTLSSACETPRQELLRTLNTAPGGTLSLIGMREDLLKLPSIDAIRDIVDQDFALLFRAWFNRGFLQLRHIDWQTPALILEKLIHYESVHEIKGWPDLRRRLQQDRRCFGFFHPAIPDVPLIFVEVALTHGISNNIQELLQPASHESDKPFNTAVFYSINNCLFGLRGISFGNFLIKQVVEDLGLSNPEILNFVTLSPVPGFMKWLSSKPECLQQCNAEEQAAVAALVKTQPQAGHIRTHSLLPHLLPRLCAHYLLNAKSRNKPLDAVARFHLGNGARLERLNWLADTSANGLQQSAGIMVNYVYDKDSLARNHQAYEQRHDVVASQAVRKLVMV